MHHWKSESDLISNSRSCFVKILKLIISHNNVSSLSFFATWWSLYVCQLPAVVLNTSVMGCLFKKCRVWDWIIRELALFYSVDVLFYRSRAEKAYPCTATRCDKSSLFSTSINTTYPKDKTHICITMKLWLSQKCQRFNI